MSRGRAAGARRAVLALLLASLAAVPASAGSHAGETKPIHNDHPHRHDLTLDEVGIESHGSPGDSSQAPAVSTRATDHDVVVRPEVPQEAPASPPASPPPAGPPPTPVAEDGSSEDGSSDAAAETDATNASKDASDPEATNATGSRENHLPESSESPNPARAKRTVLLTWGIGGDRVGRPSDAAATPPGAAEGVPESESVVWAAAAGHTALVTDAGALYTAGRNDSAGGGGHGSPPVADAGQLGRGGATNVFEKVQTPLSLSTSASASTFATQVACGRYHTAAVTDLGDVLTFGLNDRGQLGRAGVFGDPDAKKACGCDSGGNCACAESDGAGENDGKTALKKGDACRGGWACRDGHARFVDLGTHPVSDEPHYASFVAAGRYSTVVVTAAGDVLTWGLNACGAFSASDDDDGATLNVDAFLRRLTDDPAFASTPRFLSKDAFDGSTVEIAAVGYVHVVFLTKDGRVFTCDTGFDGYAGGLGKPYAPNEDARLGRAFILTDGETKSVDVDEATKRWALTPGEVAVFDAAADDDASSGSDSNEKTKTSVVAVDAGRCHAVLADEKGRAFAFGCGALGGSGREGFPRPLDLSKDVVVVSAASEEDETGTETGTERAPFAVDVAAGEYFTLVTTKDGSVFAFGDGNSGQFGIDKASLKTARDENPNAALDVEWFRSRVGNDVGRVLVPVAGYQHAAAIVEAYGE